MWAPWNWSKHASIDYAFGWWCDDSSHMYDVTVLMLWFRLRPFFLRLPHIERYSVKSMYTHIATTMVYRSYRSFNVSMYRLIDALRYCRLWEVTCGIDFGTHNDQDVVSQRLLMTSDVLIGSYIFVRFERSILSKYFRSNVFDFVCHWQVLGFGGEGRLVQFELCDSCLSEIFRWPQRRSV